VHVDKTMKLESALKTGDNVEVQVTDKGPATEYGRTYRPAHTGCAVFDFAASFLFVQVGI